MPLSFAFSTPLKKSWSLPQISLIFTDSYCYKLVFIRAIRGSFSPLSAAGVLIAAQVVSIVVLKKSSFVLAGATN
jgi:hypothetical protein